MKKMILAVLAVFVMNSAFAFELTELESWTGAWAPKAVEVSPDGQWAAVMNLEGMNFWLINCETLELEIEGQFTSTPAMGYNYTSHEWFYGSYAEKPVEAAWSDGGQYLWMSFHNGECVVVYDAWASNQTLVDDESLQFDEEQKVTITDNVNDVSYVEYLPSITVGSTPKVLAVSPDEEYVAVANWHSYSVSIIEKDTMDVVEEVEFGVIVRGLTFSSDSKTLYVARMGGGGIGVIDMETFTVTDTLWPSGYWNPRHIVLAEDDRTLYISDNKTGTVLSYDVIDESINDTCYVGSLARSLCVSPDGKYIYAVSHGDHEIAVIDTETFDEVYSTYYYKPMGISVSPDGTQLWVTSYGGSEVTCFEITY